MNSHYTFRSNERTSSDIVSNLSDLLIFSAAVGDAYSISQILDNAHCPIYTMVALAISIFKKDKEITKILFTHPNSKLNSYSIFAQVCMNRLQRLQNIIEVIDRISMTFSDMNNKSYDHDAFIESLFRGNKDIFEVEEEDDEEEEEEEDEVEDMDVCE